MTAVVGVRRRHRHADRGTQDHRLGRAHPWCRRPLQRRRRVDRELLAGRLRQQGRARSDSARRQRDRHRGGRVGPTQRHDHDPSARQVHRRGSAAVDPSRPVGRGARATTTSGGSTRRSTMVPKCSCRRCSKATCASPSTTTSRSTSPASSRSSMPLAGSRSASTTPPAMSAPASTSPQPGCHVLARRTSPCLCPQPPLRGAPRRRRMARGPGQ